MSDFNQAIKWLKEGKKVRRYHEGWYIKGLKMLNLLNIETGGLCTHQEFSIPDFGATDWEIYEETSGECLVRLGTDGKLWAEEFNKVLVEKGEQPYDPGTLLTWFCNAIEAGRSAKVSEEFELFFYSQEEIKKQIKTCEGHHVQQVAYSSYHDALTQICFGCKKIRTSLKKEDLKNV